MDICFIFIATVLGCIVGFVFGLFVVSLRPEKLSETDVYVEANGKRKYAILCYDCLNAANLEHMVIYRALYGNRIIWARSKKSFDEEITDVQGNQVKRFTKLN